MYFRRICTKQTTQSIINQTRTHERVFLYFLSFISVHIKIHLVLRNILIHHDLRVFKCPVGKCVLYGKQQMGNNAREIIKRNALNEIENEKK